MFPRLDLLISKACTPALFPRSAVSLPSSVLRSAYTSVQPPSLRSMTTSTMTLSTNANDSSSTTTTPVILRPQASEAEVDIANRPYSLSHPDSAHLRGEPDWVADLALHTAAKMQAELSRPLKFLVLYGSLRERSYSRLMAYEAARILTRLGADVRVYNPEGLPVKDDRNTEHPKVQELRALSEWSDGHFWCSPEQHGAITGVFKNQIDWIPLSVGSVRPTQGRTLGLAQVNGGSQSFNAVNTLRLLGRWMRMFTIPNQSSLPKAWTAFTPSGRLLPSGNRDRLVDVCEELVKVSCILFGREGVLADRYSERKEKEEHGRLQTQAEKEAALAAAKKQQALPQQQREATDQTERNEPAIAESIVAPGAGTQKA